MFHQLLCEQLTQVNQLPNMYLVSQQLYNEMPSIPKTKNIQQRNNLRELRTKKKKIRDKKTMQIVKKKLKSKSLDNVFQDAKIEQNVKEVEQIVDNVCCLAMFIIMFNLAWVIPSLIFAQKNNQCLETAGQTIHFTLSTWLKVDSYTRVSLILFSIIATVISHMQISAVLGMYDCLLCVVNIYTFFYFAWQIVGSVLFWQDLNSKGYCSGQIQIYMNILLIITFIFQCLNCLISAKSGDCQYLFLSQVYSFVLALKLCIQQIVVSSLEQVQKNNLSEN